MLASCSQEKLAIVTDSLAEGEVPEGIAVNVADFRNEYESPETRSAINVSDDGTDYQFVWGEDDVIGIFPNQGGQVAFPMASGAGTKSAVFDGGGWGLKSSSTYSAYYPLIPEFYLDKTKIPMDLSEQVQDGNGSYSHIGKVDYLAAVNSELKSGIVTFNFEHQIAVLHFIITIPAGHYNSVMLMASDNLTTQGSLNLADGKVTSEQSLPLQTLQLKNCDVAEGETLDVFMAIRPVNLEGKSLKARIYGDNGVYVISLSSKNYEPGTFYHSVRTAEVDVTNTGLPLLILNTGNNAPITSKEVYVEGSSATILNTDGQVDYYGGMKVKGRGNSTWGQPKKPYKMKFDKKQSFFGEPSDKEWVLLANHFDKSMIRSDVAYWMATNFGQFDFVPHFHFVDLMLNGKHNGLYQLGDQLKIGKNRVNVGDDGFLLEIDAKAAAEDITFNVSHIGQKINIKDPDVVVGDDNYNYVVDYVTRADAALYASNWLDEENGYKSLIDMQSFVEWYLMMEITKNSDAKFYTSCYMNLSRSGKLKMGPLWDFDISCGGYPSELWGNESVNQTSGFHIKNASWINRMFDDPAFVAAVKDRFNVYYNNKSQIISYIEEVAAINQRSVIANNKIWGKLCDKNSSDADVLAAYSEQVDFLTTWLSDRLDWLKSQYDEM